MRCARRRRADGRGRRLAAPPPPSPSPRSSGRALPRAAVPSRVVLAFVPGIALQGPAAAAGPRSGARHSPQRPAGPLPRSTLGLGPALQLRAGLPLHAGPTTHSLAASGRLHQTDRQACGAAPGRPALRPPSPPHRTPPTDCGLQPSGLSQEASELATAPGPWPQDSDSSSSPPTSPPASEGRPTSHLQRDPFPPSSQRGLLLLPDGHRVPGVPGSQIQSLVCSCGPVSFAQNPVLLSIRSSLSL